jgi:hypothetical protein
LTTLDAEVVLSAALVYNFVDLTIFVVLAIILNVVLVFAKRIDLSYLVLLLVASSWLSLWFSADSFRVVVFWRDVTILHSYASHPDSDSAAHSAWTSIRVVVSCSKFNFLLLAVLLLRQYQHRGWLDVSRLSLLLFSEASVLELVELGLESFVRVNQTLHVGPVYLVYLSWVDVVLDLTVFVGKQILSQVCRPRVFVGLVLLLLLVDLLFHVVLAQKLCLQPL